MKWPSNRHAAAAVACVAAAARQVGLQLRPDKCEVIACGGLAHSVDILFPAGSSTRLAPSTCWGPPSVRHLTVRLSPRKSGSRQLDLCCRPSPRCRTLGLDSCCSATVPPTPRWSTPQGLRRQSRCPTPSSPMTMRCGSAWSCARTLGRLGSAPLWAAWLFAPTQRTSTRYSYELRSVSWAKRTWMLNTVPC